jgi:hypothetical protein
LAAPQPQGCHKHVNAVAAQIPGGSTQARQHAATGPPSAACFAGGRLHTPLQQCWHARATAWKPPPPNRDTHHSTLGQPRREKTGNKKQQGMQSWVGWARPRGVLLHWLPCTASLRHKQAPTRLCAPPPRRTACMALQHPVSGAAHTPQHHCAHTHTHTEASKQASKRKQAS